MEHFWSGFEEFKIGEKQDIQDFIVEIAGKIDDEFSAYEDYHPAMLGEENGQKLYDLIKKVEPETMVETGVCNGFSSSIILKAMEDNGKGKLFSVDLPQQIDEVKDGEGKGAVIPPGKDSGWAVPAELRKRWTLKIGDTYRVLPKIFENLSDRIDMFLHDSGHSYETMMFEFALAWRNLKDDHYLLADNIDFSDAFLDFTEAKELKRYRLGNMGLMEKR